MFVFVCVRKPFSQSRKSVLQQRGLILFMNVPKLVTNCHDCNQYVFPSGHLGCFSNVDINNVVTKASYVAQPFNLFVGGEKP